MTPMIIALSLSAFDNQIDEVPLIAPIVQNQTSVKPEPLVHLGIIAGGFVQSGTQRGGAIVTVEAGVRFPVVNGRIGVMLAPSVAGAFNEGLALIVGVPIELVYYERLGPGHLRIRGGPSLDITLSNAADALHRYQEEAIALGATAGIAYLFDVGDGRIICDAGYRHLRYLIAGTTQATHGGFVGIGYAFWL